MSEVDWKQLLVEVKSGDAARIYRVINTVAPIVKGWLVEQKGDPQPVRTDARPVLAALCSWVEKCPSCAVVDLDSQAVHECTGRTLLNTRCGCRRVQYHIRQPKE